MSPSLRHDLSFLVSYRRQRSPAGACNARDLVVHSAALLLVVHSVVGAVTAQPLESPTPSPWSTLTGEEPIVIARGGFSGMYPDSSGFAYSLALDTSLQNVVLWCDVQLTKDEVGFCFPELLLENASTISSVYKDEERFHYVNQAPINGYFSIDYTYADLLYIKLVQGIYSRTSQFDRKFTIETVKNVTELIINVSSRVTPGLWLSIQHAAFYAENSLNMTQWVLDIAKTEVVNYISSPELSFVTGLKAAEGQFINTSKTQLVFHFLGKNEIEPTTNQTYGSLLTNLSFIKTFASGILVPKTYIWPEDEAMYLQPHTTLVTDAHKLGLRVYASGFMNDAQLSYNYSYDPVAEYLNFIDNGNFSVDGVLSDFPITPSDTIVSFSHLGKNSSKQQETTLVISKNGASGDYPDCTDKAYHKAITDGVNILDCPVQMAEDGTPFCFSSMNLVDSTTVANSSFSNRSVASIPEINAGPGIYTFSLTWEEIQTLKPEISKPFPKYRLVRNPKHKNDGKFLSLSDFLALTKSTPSLTGVLINIKNAAYLAEYQGLDVIHAVVDALAKAGYDKINTQRVMIQSTNSSVLKKFRDKSKHYELVYEVDEVIHGVSTNTIEEIKRFADSVVIGKTSVFPECTNVFLNASTGVVSKLQQSKLHVYVESFNNEFVSQPRDFYLDPTVEIDTYVTKVGVDGLITAFPKTAALYKRTTIRDFSYFSPGYFLSVITYPAAEAPSQVLTESDVAEPPLPPVTDRVPPPPPGVDKAAASTIILMLPINIGQSCSSVLLVSLAMVLADFILF